MAQITIQNESIDMETCDYSDYVIEFSYKRDNSPDTVFTSKITCSLYCDITILSRSDLTFDKIQEIINAYVEQNDLEFDEIWDIKLYEKNKIKRLENPAWEDDN